MPYFLKEKPVIVFDIDDSKSLIVLDDDYVVQGWQAYLIEGQKLYFRYTNLPLCFHIEQLVKTNNVEYTYTFSMSEEDRVLLRLQLYNQRSFAGSYLFLTREPVEVLEVDGFLDRSDEYGHWENKYIKTW